MKEAIFGIICGVIGAALFVPPIMKFIIKKQKNWKFKIISEEKPKEKKSTE